MTSSRQSQTGFALKDLLALIAVVPLFLLLSVPAGARNQSSNAAVICMRNMRELTVAWQLYAGDNSDRLVHNLHGGDAFGGAGANRFSAWAVGWETWGTEPDNTNVLFIRDARYAKISPYFTTTANVHKCPSDPYLSPAQRAKGWKERIRSVAMNGTLGNINYAANPGPLLAYYYARALRTSDIVLPSPAETCFLNDYHTSSINYTVFLPPLPTN
jgi:hypothetical protein